MTEDGTVLVVGGTGMLGSQVVARLLSRGKHVRALVRPGSDATRLETAGATIARGDMMDLDSLVRAMDGVDGVISSAAGYTRHSKGDTPQIDTIGNSNLAEAASRANIRRFVLTSILTCDQTPDVPHFWHKKLAEDRLEELGVPFAALRPGAFLDQVTRLGGDPFSKGRLTWLGSSRIPLTFVLTADLAGYLADAFDAPGIDGQRIDIGWDRPVSMQEVAEISGRLLGNRIRVRTITVGLLHTVGTLLEPVNPLPKDMAAMAGWFQSGRYVADTTRQREVFGAVPTAEDAIARLVTGLGHPVRGPAH
ncbi:SDR family oxidoreductase [Pseudarthrobacter sp. MM222]|uniref:SDR family oxidoreductase n=1 Tax=Pseudarthrobacter sp. MM222 TaxID=3018929 RepID=UPI002220D679|nr:SDR family oxidoreductase [Pseudarthrobacter sp. MM222]CAI3799219.1 2-alkyl-3-oxoalkanoate reductase [Pseudarthrobacter sp. MM222]